MPVLPRRPLVLAALSFVVAGIAITCAVYEVEPTIALSTSGAPSDERIAPTFGAGTTPTGEETTSTTVPVTTTMVVRPAQPGQSHDQTPAEIEAENGCIPGTYDPRWGDCQRKRTSLTGRVTDQAGRPVPDICLATYPGPIDGEERARTDANGRYVLEHPGGSITYRACRDATSTFGWVPHRTFFDQPLAPGETASLDVSVVQAGGVYGRVVDLDGNPVAGVCAMSTTIDESISKATDDQGRFVLPGVVPGDQVVGLRIGSAACPTVGLFPDVPTAHVVPGQWTEVTIQMQPGQLLVPVLAPLLS